MCNSSSSSPSWYAHLTVTIRWSWESSLMVASYMETALLSLEKLWLRILQMFHNLLIWIRLESLLHLPMLIWNSILSLISIASSAAFVQPYCTPWPPYHHTEGKSCSRQCCVETQWEGICQTFQWTSELLLSLFSLHLSPPLPPPSAPHPPPPLLYFLVSLFRLGCLMERMMPMMLLWEARSVLPLFELLFGTKYCMVHAVQIKPGDVIIIRYEGPKGRWMRIELHVYHVTIGVRVKTTICM